VKLPVLLLAGNCSSPVTVPLLQERQTTWEDEKEKVNGQWMTFRKQEVTEN
jgi:hypothetical protein